MYVVFVEKLYLIGVAKGYNNSFQRCSRRTKPKNVLYAYFLDEDQKFHKRKLSKLEYFISKYFKTKYKKRKFLCESCNNVFQGIVKKRNNEIECPYCVEY